jgi:hypothetical protein
MNRVFRCCNKAKPGYNKLNTGGNNPSISEAQRASQYLNTTKPSKYYANIQQYLDNRGLIFFPYVDEPKVYKQTFIDNKIVFPREKIFV